MQYEVPAQVQNEHIIQNQVQVIGGSNWDLSRSAVTTPLGPYVAPIPEGYTVAHQVPAAYSDITLSFNENSALLTPSSLKSLATLAPKSRVIVVGHAASGETRVDTLSKRRADAVASQLKRRGHRVIEVKSFGAQIPKTFEEDKSGLNRRVDVFLAPAAP